MASFEKMAKNMVESLQAMQGSLNDVVKNQETLIKQNKQILDLLEQFRTNISPAVPPEEPVNMYRIPGETED